MEDYIQKHSKFPLITLVFTVLFVFLFRDWSPHKTSLILSTVCIAISAGLMFIKYLSFRMYRSPEDALLINICLAQIVAGIVSIISSFMAGAIITGAVEERFANLVYFFVLSVALIITGNMSVFGGGSLFVIICSSAVLYWIPILKALVYKGG